MEHMSHTGLCACGCGKASKQAWLPGHDQKLRAAIEREVGGLVELRRIVEELLHKSIELKHDDNHRGYSNVRRLNHQRLDKSHSAGEHHDTRKRFNAA